MASWSQMVNESYKVKDFKTLLNLHGAYYLPEGHPDVVNAKFDTTIDKMIWSSGQYSATLNGGDPFAPDKYVTDYYTDEAFKGY